MYSSDLIRAHETAQILFSQQSASAALHEEQSKEELDTHSASSLNNPQRSPVEIILDKRLRELGKGAREGLPRTLSYEEAIAHRRQSDPQRSPADFRHKKESSHEGWERAKAFLNHVLREAVAKVSLMNHAVTHNDTISELPTARIRDSTTSLHASSTPTTITKTIHVVAVSHSGFLRVLLQNLVGKDHLQNHPQARIEASTGLFLIPNTSVTLLEFRLSSRIIMSTDWIDSIMQEFPESLYVRELTWCDHLLSDDDHAFLNGE